MNRLPDPGPLTGGRHRPIRHVQPHAQWGPMTLALGILRVLVAKAWRPRGVKHGGAQPVQHTRPARCFVCPSVIRVLQARAMLFSRVCGIGTCLLERHLAAKTRWPELGPVVIELAIDVVIELVIRLAIEVVIRLVTKLAIRRKLAHAPLSKAFRLALERGLCHLARLAPILLHAPTGMNDKQTA
eukprot:CAMPEP_0117514462 /NCGR_PEP_ID=MMETSP0784-20121206/30081_1 /TAXON_ID=39447 /ORGANISM="" /LENGTH=184 /DNA_ID=CAMNT_0005310257 /DNA_START=832 /DNA_END=1383 /DNA_ORIENTATION=+